MHTVLAPYVIALLLGAALMHATWNALLKGEAGDRVATFGVMMVTGCALSLPLVLVLPALPRVAWIWLGISVAIHNLYYFCLLRAYAAGDLGHTYPIARGLGPLLIALFSGRLFAEHLRAQDSAGALLVSLGIIALAAPSSHASVGDGGERSRVRRHRTATMYAVLTGLTIAGYVSADGMGVRASGPTLADRVAYIAWLNACEGPWLLGVALYLRPGPTLTYLKGGIRTLWRGVVGGAIGAIGYGVAIWALTTGPVAHVAAVRESSVLFAAVIGTVFLRERLSPRRIAAAAVIVAGLVLMNGPDF